MVRRNGYGRRENGAGVGPPGRRLFVPRRRLPLGDGCGGHCFTGIARLMRTGRPRHGLPGRRSPSELQAQRAKHGRFLREV